MNVIEKLKSLGVEITADIEKALSGEFLSEKEVEKKLGKVQAENESLKEKLSDAEETLKGLDGKTIDEITKERDDWKRKAEESETKHAEKMAEIEKQELLKEAFASVEFTSESAKKTIVAQITEGVTVKNGKLIGFNDLLEDAKKNDASAFVNKEQQEQEENKAKFTEQFKGNPNPNPSMEDLGKMSMADYIKARKNS